MLEQLIVTSITMFLFILFVPSCIELIARMPSGVAAPFMPSIFALIFMLINCFDSLDSDFFPKIQLIRGDKIFDNNRDMLVCSRILKIPVQTAYTAHRLKHKETALLDDVESAGNTLSGFINNKTEILVKIIMSQTLFMVQYMMKN